VAVPVLEVKQDSVVLATTRHRKIGVQVRCQKKQKK
jgi:hypothetical protein